MIIKHKTQAGTWKEHLNEFDPRVTILDTVPQRKVVLESRGGKYRDQLFHVEFQELEFDDMIARYNTAKARK